MPKRLYYFSKRSILTRHGQGERMGRRLEWSQIHPPFAAGVRRGFGGIISERNRDGFTGVGPAPDRNLDPLLAAPYDCRRSRAAEHRLLKRWARKEAKGAATGW